MIIRAFLMIWPMSGSKGPFILTSVFFMIANLDDRIAKISLKLVLMKHNTMYITSHNNKQMTEM